MKKNILASFLSNWKQPFFSCTVAKTHISSIKTSHWRDNNLFFWRAWNPQLVLEESWSIPPIWNRNWNKTHQQPQLMAKGRGGRSAGRAKQKPPGSLNKVCQRSRKLASVQVETTGRASEWIGPFPAALRIWSGTACTYGCLPCPAEAGLKAMRSILSGFPKTRLAAVTRTVELATGAMCVSQWLTCF